MANFSLILKFIIFYINYDFRSHEMAPIAPSKRRSLREKVAAKTSTTPHAPRLIPRVSAATISDSFINSKKDKRQIKHSSFVSRIEKANQKTPKRRRPGKKLVTNLDSLASALPDLLEGGETEEGLRQLREGKVRHKSIKSRKGALKKKERIVKDEVGRFGVSLARLNAVGASDTGAAEMQVEMQEGNAEAKAQGQAQSQTPSSTASRWAALRGFISATMEQNPAFIGKQDGK
ncbi:ribosome biogenesis protein SLX9-domain-containing protein [Biscogniauxia marginata]|nr:ribosome biogenesis protein SLX9-domain-containing protein [Biscogniauxia marginata]